MSLIKENFLVVSDYNWLPEKIEDSWVHKWTNNYLIYDRAHRFKESDKVKHQINVGQNIFDIFFGSMRQTLHEIAGLVVYRLTGRSNQLLPSAKGK